MIFDLCEFYFPESRRPGLDTVANLAMSEYWKLEFKEFEKT